MHESICYMLFYRQIFLSALFSCSKILVSACISWKSTHVAFLHHWDQDCVLVSQLPIKLTIFIFLNVTDARKFPMRWDFQMPLFPLCVFNTKEKLFIKTFTPKLRWKSITYTPLKTCLHFSYPQNLHNRLPNKINL